MKALWTDKALNRIQRLRQVQDYLGGQDHAHVQLIDRLTRLAGAIAQDPRAGLLMPYFDGMEVREATDGTYRIAYRVLPDAIHILTVRRIAPLLGNR
jgi:hypothetical protein